MGDPKILKKKIFLTFFVIIILIFLSGILGWIITQKLEKSEKIINAVHSLKEAELQLRREEKNLLIRGYSKERYLRWQKAKENFHQRFGELMGMNALNESEIINIKKDYSEMSGTYNKFFDEIRSNTLTQNDKSNYDDQFRKIGRKTLGMINSILSREQIISDKTDSQANILIVAFLIIFISAAGFLIVNVIKHL